MDLQLLKDAKLWAEFDGGAITSDAGGLLLGAADRAIKLTERFAACFHDTRRQHLIEHEVVTLLTHSAPLCG